MINWWHGGRGILCPPGCVPCNSTRLTVSNLHLFKCQPVSGTGWFPYKIWTNNSKTPMVNLLKNHRPFQNYNGKSIFRLLEILTKTLRQNFLNSNYIALYKKTALKLVLHLRKCPNQKMHESESVCFLVWELPSMSY